MALPAPSSGFRAFHSSLLAAWGPELLPRLVQEALSNKQHISTIPSILNPSQTEETWKYLESLENSSDYSEALTVTENCGFGLLEHVASQRRQKGPGLFICVIIPKQGWACKFKTFEELRFISAAFERPSEIELSKETELLNAMVSFVCEGLGNVATTFAMPINQLETLKLLDEGKGRYLMTEFQLAKHAIPPSSIVCSGGFGGLAVALMLSSAWHRKINHTSLNLQITGAHNLASWWNELDLEKRLEICPWLNNTLTGSQLIEELKTWPLGIPNRQVELENARAEHIALLLVEEETLERAARVKPKKKKKSQKSQSVDTPEIPIEIVRPNFFESVSKTQNLNKISTIDSAETCPQHPLVEQILVTEVRERRGSSSDFSAFETISEEDDDLDKWETATKRKKKRDRKNLESDMAKFTTMTEVLLSIEEKKLELKLEQKYESKPNGETVAIKEILDIKAGLKLAEDEKVEKDFLSKKAFSSTIEDRSNSNQTKLADIIDVNTMNEPEGDILSSRRSKGSSRSPSFKKPTRNSPSLSPAPSPLSPRVVNSLHSDIREMAAALDIVALRRQPWQMAVAERVKQVLYSIWPRAWCDVFGSIASGLAAPCSDVDLIVRGVPQSDRVRVLAQHLQREDWVQMVQAVERTAVPVIKFYTAAIPIAFGNRGNLIAIDITFENEAHHGLNTCGLVRQFVQRWPPLKPLVLVLKQYLVEKGLNDPYVGGLSSYGLVLLVASILKRQWPTGLDPSESFDLGLLFIEFLDVYSSKSFLDNGVRFSTEGRKPVGDPCYIEDPLDPNNNVGRSCFGIREVVKAFATARESIRQYQAQIFSLNSSQLGSTSMLGSVFSTSHHSDVVRLVTKVWCPPELPSSQAATRHHIVPPKRFFQYTHQLSRSNTASDRPAVDHWAKEARDLILKMANKVQNESGNICPSCSQPTGPSHVSTNCEMSLLLKRSPL